MAAGVADPSAFRAATGWSPRIGLDMALLPACRHYRATKKLQSPLFLFNK
ncbi:MAG: hypothetical protein WCS31_09570 [Verrucomicrobiae bacterium]